MIHRYSAIRITPTGREFVNLDSICVLKRGEEITDMRGNTEYIICCETATYTMAEYKAMRERLSK